VGREGRRKKDNAETQRTLRSAEADVGVFKATSLHEGKGGYETVERGGIGEELDFQDYWED
jgi:hypothetical protein